MRKSSVLLVFIASLLLSGCGQNKSGNGINSEAVEQSRENTNIVEQSSEKPVEENIQSATSKKQDNLQRTSHYLFFDEEAGEISIRINLKDISSMMNYDKVVCYRDEKLVTDKTKVLTTEDYVLEFAVEEYVDSFNRLEIYSGNDSEFIEVGEYHFDKLGKNTIKNKAQIELVSYQLDEGIDDIDADFFLNGDFTGYRVECQIPDKLRQTGLVEYDHSLEYDGLEFDCELSEAKFRKSNLYSVEFDMVVLQKHRKTDKQYKIAIHRLQLMEQ